MTLWKLTKGFAIILIAGLVLVGLVLMAGDALLEGPEYATFFGYKLSSNFINDDNKFLHIGDAIIIYASPQYEYHHDTPVAFFDEEDNNIFIYRIVCTESETVKVVDMYGTILTLPKKNIVGRVIEL